MNDFIMIYRKLVMPGDENHAKALFGGTLLKWADEAIAVYAMCQMGTQSLVTLKISEVLFRHPSRSGDVLEFWARNKKVGNTSLTIEVIVIKKTIGKPMVKPVLPANIQPEDPNLILNCEFVMVSVDEQGKPKAHLLSAI